MGAKLSVLGLIVSFPPHLRSAMVRFPFWIVYCVFVWNSLNTIDRMFSFVRAEKTKKYFKFILYCLSNKSSMFKKLFIEKAEIARNI